MTSDVMLHDDDVTDEPLDSVEVGTSYRTLSRGAVFAAILAVVSLPLVFWMVGDESAFYLVLILPLIAVGLGLTALVRIRRYPDELTGTLPALVGAVIGTLTLIGGIGGQAYILATEVPDGYKRVTWYELKPRGEELRFPFPSAAARLDGKKVFIKGYVHPDTGLAPVQQCMLVGDMGTCCFGGNPKLNERIDVVLENDLRISYSTRLRKLGGTFVLNVDPREPIKPDDGSKGTYYVLKVDYLK
jgi:hypothetical protein